MAAAAVRSLPLLLLVLLVVIAASASAFLPPPSSSPAAVASPRSRALAPAQQSRPAAITSSSFSRHQTPLSGVLPLPLWAAADGDDDGEPQYDAAARAKIEELVQGNKIVLFMKGTRLFPSCGFSNTAVRILDTLGVEYTTVDVLADDRIRAEIKRFSEWPTIPQLYLQGEFIGGSDIMLSMYESGELLEAIEVAAAS